jgi:hypothetical protein
MSYHLTWRKYQSTPYSGTAKELSKQREQRTKVIVLVPQQLTGKLDEIILFR